MQYHEHDIIQSNTVTVSAQQNDKNSFQRKAIKYNSTTNYTLLNSLYKNWTLLAASTATTLLYWIAFNFHDNVATPVHSNMQHYILLMMIYDYKEKIKPL